MAENFIKKSYTHLILVILFLLFIPLQSAYSQFACLPGCDVTDGEFLTLAAMGLSTSNNRDAEFHITSSGTSETVEIGIFDGDGTFDGWDINNAPFVILEYKLFLDPEGEGKGNNILLATWSSDGTFGDNVGDPMPDDDWFIRVIQNLEQARTATGYFSYRLEMRNLNPQALGLNGYKVRSDGTIAIPAGSAFNYTSPPRSMSNFETLYPNVDFDDPACVDINRPGFFCNPLTDPDCCLNPTKYDGEWKFCFEVPEAVDTLDIWDGDFDFGSASVDAQGNCMKPDGIDLDTDDPNTPIPLPEWALNTDAITQGVSVPTEPADDNGCSPLTNRPPSVVYDLVGPNGETYSNLNPSGNIEWELFNISTEPFNPNLYDIHVDSIEPGIWCVRTQGNDLQNLNSFRLPYAVIGLDENDEPVLSPPTPASVPTLSHWGIGIFISFSLLVSIYFVRSRKFDNRF